VPAVARLRALDPVTTEVVRLRGAAQHNCRLCKSLRKGNALDAGGSESLYADIEALRRRIGCRVGIRRRCGMWMR